MNECTVTISKDYESCNKVLINLILINDGMYNPLETKDGTVYEIKFSNIDKMEKFKEIVSEQLKFISN